LAAKAAAGPPELVRQIKETLADMAAIDDHSEAVERELDPQVWSINQPEFAERLAALQARITRRS
jgi:enoyl-CoA hydratase